jgi:hypothetical protein
MGCTTYRRQWHGSVDQGGRNRSGLLATAPGHAGH